MAGLELDVDLGPLEVVAKLAASFDGVQDEMRAARLAEMRRRNQLRTQVPIDYNPREVATCPSPTTPFTIGLGGPEAGFYWLVRRITVGGLQWSTTAAGTAEVYVSGLTGNVLANIRSLTDMADEAMSMPKVAFYSSHQLILIPRNKLSVVIVTGTAGQQYTASAQIEVHRQVGAAEEYEA